MGPFLEAGNEKGAWLGVCVRVVGGIPSPDRSDPSAV